MGFPAGLFLRAALGAYILCNLDGRTVRKMAGFPGAAIIWIFVSEESIMELEANKIHKKNKNRRAAFR